MKKATKTEQKQMRDFALIFGKDSYLSMADDGARLISTLAGAEGHTIIARYDLKNDMVESLIRERDDIGAR